MGKRGPKSKFTDIACSNEACKDLCVAGHETFPVMAHIKQETKPFEHIFAIVAGKHFVIVQILFIITFAKTNPPLISLLVLPLKE
jgi:hypothetical protein